jgi:hypothetical protein
MQTNQLKPGRMYDTMVGIGAEMYLRTETNPDGAVKGMFNRCGIYPHAQLLHDVKKRAEAILRDREEEKTAMGRLRLKIKRCFGL